MSNSNTYSWGSNVLAVVIGDFGRDASLRFCSFLSDMEREFIKGQLPADALFYDEYRRVILYSIGDLPFIKDKHLRKYKENSLLLDNRILAGSHEGIEISELEHRIGILVFNTVAAFVERDISKVLILNPCNTLSPVFWKLEETFSSFESIREMLMKTKSQIPESDMKTIRVVADRMHIRFPTVPEAVIREIERQQKKAFLPVGMGNIAEVYRLMLAKLGSDVQMINPETELRARALDAINANIDRNPVKLKESERLLRSSMDGKRYADAAILEACTDFNTGFGLDSNKIYAQAVINMVYKEDWTVN